LTWVDHITNARYLARATSDCASSPIGPGPDGTIFGGMAAILVATLELPSIHWQWAQLAAPTCQVCHLPVPSPLATIARLVALAPRCPRREIAMPLCAWHEFGRYSNASSAGFRRMLFDDTLAITLAIGPARTKWRPIVPDTVRGNRCARVAGAILEFSHVCACCVFATLFSTGHGGL